MTTAHIDRDASSDEAGDGRRNFLKLGGAAAAAAAAAGIIGGAGRAGASSGQTITVDNAFSGIGTTQLTDSQLKVIVDNGNRVALWGQNLTTAASGPGNGVQGDGIIGVVGNTNATTGGIGVQGSASSGTGVRGVGADTASVGVNAVNTGGGTAFTASATSAANGAAVTQAGTGVGLNVANTNAANANGVVVATHAGKGFAIRGVLSNATNASPALRGDTSGTGAAIVGNGNAKARGADLLSGTVAQARLRPGTLASHPATGLAGDFYVDKSNRLWFCKGGATWRLLA